VEKISIKLIRQLKSRFNKMQKYISKNTQKGKDNYNLTRSKNINRPWGNAKRLERVNVRNKNKGKK